MNLKKTLKPLLFPLLKAFYTAVNTGRILLKKDLSKASDYWIERGKHTELCDIQIDGFISGRSDVEKALQYIENDLLTKFSTLVNSAMVLDYGCGTGRYLELFKNKGFMLYGIDYSNTVLENFTRKKLPQAFLISDDFSQNSHYPRNNQEKFDAVFSITVLQYVPWSRLEFFLKNLCLILKPGGFLYLAFPHPQSVLEIVSDLRYIRHFPCRVEEILSRNNLTIIQSHSIIHEKKVDKIDFSNKTNYGYLIFARKGN